MISKRTLREWLFDETKDYLQQMCKEKGIRVSRYDKKADLCVKLSDHMLQKDQIKKYFSFLFDHEIERIEIGMFCYLRTGLEESSSLISKTLRKSKYAFRSKYSSEEFYIPYDVADAYLDLKSEEFREYRKKTNRFYGVLMAVGTIWGSVPISVAAPLMQMEEYEVERAIALIPPELNDYLVLGDTICHKILFIEEAGLKYPFRMEEYYIPTEAELFELSRFGYLPNRPEVRKLVEYIKTNMTIWSGSAEYIAMMVQKIVAIGTDLDGIFRFLSDWGFEESEELLDQLTYFMKNTRKMINCGFTDQEKKERGDVVRICTG